MNELPATGTVGTWMREMERGLYAVHPLGKPLLIDRLIWVHLWPLYPSQMGAYFLRSNW